MTTQTLPEDQLLELLVQLQKTTPEQARAILNGQPAIGYALVPLMAKMGIVNLEVLQKTLSVYAAQTAGSNTTVVPTPAPPPVPSVPQHLAQQVQPPYGHHPTPPPVLPPQAQATASHSQTQAVQSAAPAVAQGVGAYGGYPSGVQNGTGYGQYGQQQQQQQQQQQYGGPQYGAQQNQQPPPTGASTATPPASGTGMLGALGNIPDDQREMIMRVISMTPEQINRLPPQDRAITIQLRATLGLPTE